ncbi:T9SS sorting signal type C domain-containing protein [Flavobacterium sp. ZT3R25]|uniref:T9SS sorting signal type C domain-containing protein n=1 Tax=Flavobacterium galactosi TaxID=3398735 RepID=UPI003A85F67D
MKIFLPKSTFFTIIFLLFAFSGNVIAQTYTITGNVNASTLSCNTFTGFDIINIGNGATTSNLIMNGDLDLTTCSLGPIQIIVNNATIDFSTANKRVYLPEGSSIVFVNGGTLNPAGGTSGGCTGNDRVYIGGVLMATCQGGSGFLGFDDLITLGGTGSATSNSPVCVGNSINLSASPSPNGGPYTYSWSGPNGFSSTSRNPTITNSVTAAAGIYTVTMTSTTLSSNKSIVAQATIVVNSGSTTAAPTVTLTQPTCYVSTGNITITAPTGSGMKYSIDGLTYINTNGVFATLVSGTYNVTARNSSGCISSGTSVSINVQPATPVQPILSTVTQPTCTTSKGSFTITNYNASYTYVVSPLAGVTISGNTVTAPTGSYTLTATLGTCTSIASSSKAVNAQPVTPTAGLTSNDADNTFCLGTSVTFTASGGTNYNFRVAGTSVQSGAAVTFNTTALTNGQVVDVIVTNASGCTATSSGITNTVNSLPTAPTFTPGDITQPNCSTVTGSVLLSGLPATGVWNLYQNGSVTPLITAGAGISTTITGLSTGTYTYTVSNGTCMSVVSANVVIDPVITATWNVISGVGSWTNGPPTSAKSLIFNGLYSSVSDVDGCSCQVNSGSSVTILLGGTLKITNGVAVLGTGILTFENTASLVQINDNAINSGNITYRRNNSTTRETDYTYWSSPVAGQTLKKVSPKTPSNFFYSFNAAVNDWNQENSANVMTIGLGYIIRGPHYTSIPPPGFYEAIFQGVPNNGNISIPIPFTGKATSNLIGNPYPSALNADLFLTTNSAVLDGTLYFWTHKTEIGIGVSNPGTGVYAYSSDDYATYNLTGGTATRTGNIVGLVEETSNRPSGKIASGQGFFVSGKAAGNVVFNNSMRISGGASGVNNAQFFKVTKNSKTINTIEKHRVWLNLSNNQGAFKQTLVGYVTNATNGYDDAFDGQSFDGNKFVDFYSVNESENLTIQGRALPFDENDKVPLGFSSTIKGVFSIAIDEVDGLLASQDIFIEDKKSNCVKNLKEGAYSFSTEAGVFNDRFILRYTNTNTNKTLGKDTFNTLENIVLVSKDKNELKIKSELENIKRITVFDLLGRKVFDKGGIESNEFNILNSTLNKQTVIVKITLTTGQIISKKVIY